MNATDKWILVLGAGAYQVPLINAAKAMGCKTVVASIPGPYPGFEMADIAAYVDTSDRESILEVAREHKVNGICTAGTDVALPSLGYACEALGLPGVSYESATLASNKTKMKEAFAANGVNTAPFVRLSIASPAETIAEACEKLAYPVMFKAVDSSGSRGIIKVSSEAEIEHALSEVARVSKTTEFLVESFLDGFEVGAQAFVQQGAIEFVLPHGDYVFNADAGVPIGHYAPLGEDKLAESISRETSKAIRALGLDNCAVNADLIVTPKGTYVLEIGARSGATGLAEMVGLYFGYDYYKKIVEVALGMNADFSPTESKESAVVTRLITSDKTGIIDDISLPSTLPHGIVDVTLDCKRGDAVSKFKIGPDRIGQITAVDKSVEEAEADISAFLDEVRITVSM